MKLLAFFSDQDLDSKLPTPDRSGYNVRRAGRAILINSKGEIALMWVGKHSMYKLPGGGIDDEIGITIELRDQWKFAQISYAYRAVATEETKGFNLTDEEIENGFARRLCQLVNGYLI